MECLASEVPDCLSVLKVTLYGNHPLKHRGSAALHIRVADLASTNGMSQRRSWCTSTWRMTDSRLTGLLYLMYTVGPPETEHLLSASTTSRGSCKVLETDVCAQPRTCYL